MDRTPAYLSDMAQFVRELREIVRGKVDHEVLYKSISEDLPALQVAVETWLAAKRQS